MIKRIFSVGTGMPGGAKEEVPELPLLKRIFEVRLRPEGERKEDTRQELPFFGHSLTS